MKLQIKVLILLFLCMMLTILTMYFTTISSQDSSISSLLHHNVSCEAKTKMNFRRLPKRNWVYKRSSSSSYKGPIVNGWPPGASRDINDYLPKRMESNYLVKARNINLDSTEIIILVKTRITAYENRNRIRQVWGKLLGILKPGTKIIYLIGKDKENPKNPVELQKEIQEYGDIVQGNFIDSYYNLTLKLLVGHQFVTDLKWSTRPKMTFLMDDDMFVNVPKFLSVIEDLNRRCEGPYYIGHTSPEFNPIADDNEWKYSSKWGVPTYMAEGAHYPGHTFGIGTLMSYETVECILEEAYNLPYFHIDDVFIGFAAYRCGIDPESISGMTPMFLNEEGFDCSFEIAILMAPRNLGGIFRKVLKYNNLTHLEPMFKIPEIKH